MDSKRREEVRKCIDEFRNVAVTDDLLKAFCERHHFDLLTLQDFIDYKYQVEHDEKVQVLFPLILAAVQKIAYIPEFASDKDRKDALQANDEVRVSITKLLEEHAFPYHLVQTSTEELGNMIGRTVSSAGQTAFNRAIQVLNLLAKEKFGGAFNMKNVADYLQENETSTQRPIRVRRTT